MIPIHTYIYIYRQNIVNLPSQWIRYLPSPANRLSGQVGNRPPGHKEGQKTCLTRVEMI